MPRAPSSQSGSSTRTSHSSKRHRHRPARAAAPQPQPQPPPFAAAPSLHRSSFHCYNAQRDSWLPHIPNCTWDAQTALTLLTLNTWSSSPSHSPHQTLALYSLLQSSQADLIALQEVTAPFWDGLIALPWVREGYATAGGGAEGWWGVTESAEAGGRQRKGKGGVGKKGEREAVVLLVRKGLFGEGSEAGIGVLGRGRDEGGKGWLEIRLRDATGKERVRIATSHFSSLPANSALRQSQYRTVLQSLHTSSPSASSLERLNNASVTKTLLGDFNASNAAELSLITSSHPLFDAFPPSSRHHHSHHVHPRGDDHSAHPHPPSRPTPAQDEATFRHPPTFGHLYPYVPGAPRNKPRKARRIDRVYFSASPSAQTHCKHYSHVGEGPLHHHPPNSQQHIGAEHGSAVEHHHQRNRGKKGPKIRDRESVDGWMRASDHAGVRVVLEGI